MYSFNLTHGVTMPTIRRMGEARVTHESTSLNLGEQLRLERIVYRLNDEKEAVAHRPSVIEDTDSMHLKTAPKLGVWIDGVKRFISRDADEIHRYARDAMNDKRNTSVWLAPVGSFIGADA